MLSDPVSNIDSGNLRRVCFLKDFLFSQEVGKSLEKPCKVLRIASRYVALRPHFRRIAE